MKKSSTIFGSVMLKQARQEFIKHFPAQALKGIWTSKFGKIYEAHLPPNTYFPKGKYVYGQFYGSAMAKAELIFSLLKEKEK